AHRVAGRDAAQIGALGTGLRLAGGCALTLALIPALGSGFVAPLFRQPESAFALAALSPVVVTPALAPVLVPATLAARTSKVHLAVRGIAEPVLVVLAPLVAWGIGAGIHGLIAAHVVAEVTVLILAVVGVRRVLGRGVIREALRAPPEQGFVRFA